MQCGDNRRQVSVALGRLGIDLPLLLIKMCVNDSRKNQSDPKCPPAIFPTLLKGRDFSENNFYAVVADMLTIYTCSTYHAEFHPSSSLSISESWI